MNQELTSSEHGKNYTSRYFRREYSFYSEQPLTNYATRLIAETPLGNKVYDSAFRDARAGVTHLKGDQFEISVTAKKEDAAMVGDDDPLDREQVLQWVRNLSKEDLLNREELAKILKRVSDTLLIIETKGHRTRPLILLCTPFP